MIRPSLALLASFTCLAAPAAGGVIRIAEQPALAFTSLQAAIDAAPDGGLLLVGSGTFASASIVGKSLSIVELPGSVARISGTLSVANLSASQRVLVAGLELRGGQVALALADSAGHVRIQGCAIRGGDVPGPLPANDGAPAVTVLRCARVIFAGCAITGGDARPDFGGPGPTGGVGIESTDGTFALYDCTVRGGSGGAEGCDGGEGGDACRLGGRGLFAFGSTLTGGSGGNGDSLNCCNGGGGGDGLDITLAHAELFDSPVQGGAGGSAACGTAGSAGLAVRNTSATVSSVPGSRRKLAGASLASDGAALALEVHGQRGDQFFLLASPRPGFAHQPALHGLYGVSVPAFSQLLPLGTIGPSGILSLNLPIGALAAGTAHRPLHLQGVCIDAASQATLTGPLALEFLDRAGGSDCDGDGVNDFVGLLEQLGPDCNANLALDVCDLASGLEQDCNSNGTPDSCEIAAGLEPDCDGNGVPDACDVASGAGADCNSNGTLDACDIASGASLDTNGNGVPDECEVHVPLTLWVDPAAPPGGNGAPASPFDTLQAAIAAAFHGDTVMLRDGVYSGPANRDLDPAGREIVIRSQNGPAACIVDCQFLGRAFSIRTGEGPNLRIQGLTIRGGNSSAAPHTDSSGGGIFVGDAQPTISGCVFEDCIARLGGGISAAVAPLRIEGCAFRRCQGLAIPFFPSSGGAIYAGFTLAQPGTLPAIVGCEFSDCVADFGGAIRFSAPSRTVISHCRFLGNLAVGDGGAIFATSTSSSGQQVFLIEDCVMNGNVATRGGVLWTQAFFCCPTTSAWSMSSCTLFDNAAQQGSGVFVQAPAIGGPPLEIHNSILWNNFSPAADVLFQAGGAMTVHVFASDVLGGPASFVLAAGSTLSYGGNNLQVDPLFNDPDGPDNLLGTYGDNDFRLGPASPCIDAGDNALVAPDHADVDHDGDVLEPVPLDLDLLPRFFDVPGIPNTGQGAPPHVDFGPYERQP